MSQVESVSTMNMSVTKRMHIMKKAEFMTKMPNPDSVVDGNSVIDEQNQANMATINRLMADSKPIDTSHDDEMERIKQLHLEELIKNYKINESYDKELPITALQSKIIDHIENNKFCIIRGTTGSGKTTQVPQYILDYHMKEKKYCNIIVTQPRRIAATSVAMRVCNERGWNLGGYCGYQIGLDRSKVTEDTRITYVTTGVLLQKLIGPQAHENFNSKYTHIILDEVHERDLDTDLLLLVIKIQTFFDLKAKVVLMSATMESDLFAKYFAKTIGFPESVKIISHDKTNKRLVPILDIKSTTYNVQEFYWDNLVANNSFMTSIINRSFKSKFDQLKMSASGFKTNQQSYSSRSSQIDYNNNAYSNLDLSNEFNAIRTLRSQMQSLEFSAEEADIREETILMCINLLRYFDELEIKLITSSKEYMRKFDEEDNEDTDCESTNAQCDQDEVRKRLRILDGFPEFRDSVLIFVPGMHHIQVLKDRIEKELNNKKLIIIPLHSDIVMDQQNRVFEKAPPCYRKVIISTSIAESSITVPDVKYVIDFCLTKELYCDPYTNYTHLRLEWASKSSMNQRRGRAGRVSDGICYRLVPKAFFDESPDQTKPSILREPLSRVILNVKRLRLSGDPARILSMAIQPPKRTDIERTVLLLKEVGALTLKSSNSNSYDQNDGDLTYAGKIMANLPIDVRLSKLILLGHAFGKLKEAIIIACGLSTKTFFTCYFKSYLESFKNKWMWSQGWMCDCISILNAYNVYEKNKLNGLFMDRKEAKKWAQKNMIELDRILEVDKLKDEIERRLKELDIKCNKHISLEGIKHGVSDAYNIDDNDDVVSQNLILKLIIAGAFYPNYFNAQKIDLSEAYKMVNGKDLHNTVQVKNLPINEGILYHQKLTEIFKACSQSLNIQFEDSKAYVQFKSNFEHVASNVNLGVYLAVQMRLLRIPLRLEKYKPSITQAKLRQLKSASHQVSISLDKNRSGALKFNFLNESNNSIVSRNAKKPIETSSVKNDNDDDDDDTITGGSVRDPNETFDDPNVSEDEYNKNVSFMTGSNNKVRSMNASRYLSMLSLEESFNQSMSIHGSSMSLSSQGFASVSNKPAPTTSNTVLMRKLNSNCITPCMGSLSEYLSNPKYLLPPEVDQNLPVKILITETVGCGHFYAQIDDEKHHDAMSFIHQKLNSGSFSGSNSSSQLFSLKKLTEIHEDMLCVSEFSDRDFYRARIISVDRNRQEVEVQYIDYGNKEKVDFVNLYELSFELQEYPYQAVECRVSNIKPSILRNPNGAWTKSSSEKFKAIVEDKKYESFKIIVKGIDENIALVNLYGEHKESQTQHQSVMVSRDIGLELVNLGYADVQNEKSINDNKSKFSSELLYIPTRTDDYITKKPVYDKLDANVIKKKYRDNDDDESGLYNTSSYDDTDRSSIAESDRTYSSYYDDRENCFSGYIDIRGPYSPLEINYYSLVNSGHSKKIRVERESINYVTLDDDPHNDCNRLMVASDVTLNGTGETMIMRKTCLMPKQPGLSAICCLLFSPRAEMRVDERGTRYTGALCGLGYDEKNRKAINSDNDIECAFDVKIDMNDLTMV